MASIPVSMMLVKVVVPSAYVLVTTVVNVKVEVVGRVTVLVSVLTAAQHILISVNEAEMRGDNVHRVGEGIIGMAVGMRVVDSPSSDVVLAFSGLLLEVVSGSGSDLVGVVLVLGRREVDGVVNGPVPVTVISV